MNMAGIYEEVNIKNPHYINGSSYPEQLIYNCLQQLFNVTNRKKEPVINLEFDIVVRELNLRIEYSGLYWHVNKGRNDEIRRKYCRNRAINYIEILEGEKEPQTLVTVNNLHTIIHLKNANNFTAKNESLFEVINMILNKFGHSISEIDTERAIYESLRDSKRFKYNIVRNSSGKILGTENKIFVEDTYNYDDSYTDYVEDDLEQYKVEIEEPKANTEVEIEEPKANTEVEVKQVVTNREEKDVTLVNQRTVSNKEFNKICKAFVNRNLWD